MDVPLCPGCKERDARIAELERRNAELEKRVAALELLVHDLTRKLQALPPRAASPLPAGPFKKRSQKKPGGQPGHSAHMKPLLPIEQVDEVVPFIPKQCEQCQHQLPHEPSVGDPEPTRHQFTELLEKPIHVTEYQGHSRTCPHCEHITKATIPADIRGTSIGTRLTAAMSYMAGCQGMSKRGIEETVETLLSVPISLGTICNLEQEMSAALAEPHREAVKAIQESATKNADETGWKKAGIKRWLWVAATSGVVAFLIQLTRNLKAMRNLLGEPVVGIVTTDRWCVYDNLPAAQRQLCWAHLKRNWEKLAERGGRSKELAKACLAVHKQVFEIWHLYRGGGITRPKLQERMAILEANLLQILQDGEQSRVKKLARFCTRLRKVFPSMWTFVKVEGIEPTNNHGERVQRRAVIWRRRAFGCHSENGCRFVERILTAVESLKLQKRSVLGFLQDAITAHRGGKKAPSLLPASAGG